MKQIEDGNGMPAAGQMIRAGFAQTEVQTQAEVASVAVAAQAKAAVEARYIMAMKRPRDLREVELRLLHECKRPGFAAVARYEKPIGKDKSKWPKGPSIRFAEAALRCLGNVMPETMVIFESEQQRILQVVCTDLESNLTYSAQIVVQKTVERKFLKDGQVAISTRINSYGDPVHLVEATEDDLLNKQNALVSKALRTLALRLLPGDILEACMAEVLKTLRSDIQKDPDAALKAMLAAFFDVNISPTDIAAFLGHSVERIQPAEIEELRAVYSAIKDGEATWDAVMEARESTGSAELHQEVKETKAADAKAKLERMKAEEKAAALGVGLKGKAPAPPPPAQDLSEAEMNAQMAAADAQQEQPESEPLPHTPEAPAQTGKPAPKFTFGGKK